MTDDQGANGTPADPNAQPPAGNDGATPPAGDGQAGAETISLDEAKSLRSENKSLRTRLRELEKAEQARTEAEKSEIEKANDRATAAERDLATERLARQDYALRLETASVARRLGFRDPDLAFRLVPAADVEFDESGQPKNIDRLLGDLVKSHPYLANGTADYGGGPRGTPAAGGRSMDDLIRQAAGRR